MAARETTNDRLFDAIERAKQEVHKSREVLRMNLTSTSPGGTSSGVSPQPAPSASLYQEAQKSYSAGMGLPVVPPELPGYAAATADTSTVSASVLPASLTVPAATPAPAAAAAPAATTASYSYTALAAAAALSAVPSLGDAQPTSRAASAEPLLRSTSAMSSASGGCLPPRFSDKTGAAAAPAAPPAPLATAAPAESFPAGGGPRQGTSVSQELERLLSQSRERAAATGGSSVGGAGAGYAPSPNTPSPPRAAPMQYTKYGSDAAPALPSSSAVHDAAPSYTTAAATVAAANAAAAAADSAAYRATAPSLPAPPAVHAAETPVPRPVAVPCAAPSALPAAIPAVGATAAAAAAATSADSPSAAVRAASPQRSEPPLSPPPPAQQQQDDLVMSPSVSLSPPRMGGAVMRALNSPPPAGAGLGGADAEAAAAQHAADQAELRRLRETLAQRDDDVARRDDEIGFLKAKNAQLQTRAAEQEAAAAASAVHEARAAQLEKEVEEVRQELSQRRQEFAQQKAALLLRYGLDQPQDDAASASAETEAAAPVPAVVQPAATTVLPPPPARSASACSAVSAEPAAASAPVHRAVPRPDRSRTPERSAPLQQPAWNGSSGPPPRSGSANTVESNAITVVGGDEHRRAGTPAARKPAVPRRSDRPAGHSPDPARSSAARARSRTPERAAPPPSTVPTKPTTPRAGFAKRKVRDPSAVAADELLSEPAPAELVRLGAATDPPEDAAGWKQLLAQRRRTVHATHPCLASGAAAAEVDASGDAGISPCAAGGAAERKEIATGLWMLTAATLRGGTQLSFYNALPDTQFNLRYTFGEGSRMAPAHQDTVERAPGDFSVSVFPGETKPFVEGSSTSSKMSLSYGPVEVLAKQPRPLQAETRAEVAAVKQVLMHAADAKRVGGADLEALCAKAGARFVDLTFPPLPSSVARLWDAGCDALQNDVWAWRRMKLTPPPSALETLAAQDVAGGSLSGVGTVEALSLAAAVCPATLRESICHTTADSCRVLLNRNGWWQTVTVDNHFPVNVSGEPMYAHCSTSSEQRWPSAVEKALAKLAGCYAALHAQDTASVFSAITGAVASRTALAPTDDALVWECCAAASADRPVILTARTDVMSGSGLGAGRAYAVVEARELGAVRIVRIKPLSAGKWRGDWAPMSKTWTSELSVACGADPSDGTQWISTADAARVFASSTELDLRWADATSVSVAGYFEAGVPDTLMQITYDGAATDVLVSLHQRTPAGHPSVDPDAHHAGLAAAMLHQRSKDNSYGILGMTNGGAYVADKRVAAVMPLRRGASFLVPQAFHAVDKAFVLCMRVHDHSKLSIKFVQRQKAGAASGRSFPLTITGLTAKSVLGVQGSRPYQTARRAAVANGAGSAVRWPRAAGGSPGPAEELCAALVRRTVPRAPAVRAEGCTPLEVVVVAGKGLHATAQPSCYCEVKLVQLNDAGEWLSLSGTLRRTRYVPETAAPTWGESIRFGQVAQSDYVFLKCFDKDLFSQEEMGEILLSLSEFLQTLTPGGPPSINWYPLQGQGATGTIQLSISIPAS